MPSPTLKIVVGLVMEFQARGFLAARRSEVEGRQEGLAGDVDVGVYRSERAFGLLDVKPVREQRGGQAHANLGDCHPSQRSIGDDQAFGKRAGEDGQRIGEMGWLDGPQHPTDVSGPRAIGRVRHTVGSADQKGE